MNSGADGTEDLAAAEGARLSDGHSNYRGYVFALLSAAFHAGVPVAGKYAQREMTTGTYSFLWVASIAVFACVYFSLAGKWPLVLAQVRRHKRGILLMGLCQAAASWFFFKGLTLIDPTVAAFFGRASAVFAVILGMLFLKERFTVVEAVGIAMAIGGALVISYAAGRVVWLGMCAIIASCFFFAVFTFIGKVKVRGVDPIVLVGAATTTASGILGPLAFFGGSLDFDVSVGAYVALAGAAFSGGFLGISTFYRSMKYVGFAAASVIRSAQPVFVALLAYFTIRQVPDLRGWIGGAVIMAGVMLITLGGPAASRRVRGAASPSGGGDA